MWLLALGVDASALEEVFEVRKITIRSWLCRSGLQGRKLHERFMSELQLVHVQLDEAFGVAKRRVNVKDRGQDMWLWIASDAKTKVIPVMQVGARNQEMAFSVVHELKGRLAASCVPVFSTGWLEALLLCSDRAFWEMGIFRWKEARVGSAERLYLQPGDQTPKTQKNGRGKRRVLVGEACSYADRLCQAGLSGRINTACVERVNLTFRQCVSKLTRRTWGPAKFTPELMEHLEWWRSYYHFVRYHESLEETLFQPVKRKGKQQPRRHRKRTPAM